MARDSGCWGVSAPDACGHSDRNGGRLRSLATLGVGDAGIAGALWAHEFAIAGACYGLMVMKRDESGRLWMEYIALAFLRDFSAQPLDTQPYHLRLYTSFALLGVAGLLLHAHDYMKQLIALRHSSIADRTHRASSP